MTQHSPSPASSVEFDSSALGEWIVDCDTEFAVTAARISQYAEATNDPIERHRRGEVAPPVFAVVPAFSSIAPAALSVAPVELLPTLVHGEQDFRFQRPIWPGDTLRIRSMPLGFVTNDSGSIVTVYAETRTDEGELVNEQWMSAFFRDVDAGSSGGERAPLHRLPDDVRQSEPIAVTSAHIDSDQTFRYAPAAGDPMPIHLDDEIARMAGLPGIINHGLCTMAFASWAVLTEFADQRVERLRRLAVRFAKPVLPGSDIATTMWHHTATDPEGTCIGFQTSTDDVTVITDGFAVVSPA